MENNKPDYRNLPKHRKYSLILLVLTWSFYLVSISYILGGVSLFQMTVGIFICVGALSLKSWAFFLAVAYNSFMAVVIIRSILHDVNSSGSVTNTVLGIKTASALLFILSSLLILVPLLFHYLKGTKQGPGK